MMMLKRLCLVIRKRKGRGMVMGSMLRLNDRDKNGFLYV